MEKSPAIQNLRAGLAYAMQTLQKIHNYRKLCQDNEAMQVRQAYGIAPVHYPSGLTEEGLQSVKRQAWQAGANYVANRASNMALDAITVIGRAQK